MRLLLLALLLLAPTAQAQTRLSGLLAPQAGSRHDSPTQAGDVVRGVFSGRGLRLVLRGPDMDRLLAKGERDSEEFWLIAPPQAELMVQAGEQGGAYVIDLQRPTPAAQAVPAHGEEVSDPAQVPSPLLRVLLKTGETGAFWDKARGPLVEDLDPGRVLLTFVWRGQDTRNVWLFSAPSGNHDPMRRLGGTDLWFASYDVPDSTRMTYKIAPDIPDIALPPAEKRSLILTTLRRDPLNAHAFPAHVADAYDGESVVELPNAPPQPWTGRRAHVPRGSLERHRLSSAILGNQRDMLLYRPPGYVPGRTGNGLLVLFDAEFYQDRADIAALLDNLHHAGAIPPTAALMIANPSNQTRSAELPPNPAFVRFLDEEAMPWAKARGLAAPAARTVIAGASFGGLAAAHMGLTLPHWFGNVHSQSGSFWWGPRGEDGEWMIRRAAALDHRDVRFLIEAGLFESGGKSILETSRVLAQTLRAKGYDVQAREYAGGHDLIRWHATIADGLIHFLGDHSPDSQDTSAVNR